MRQKYFDTAFASSGDLTTVPDAAQVSGSISFAQGWGVNYQRQIGVDPLAMPIDRTTMNYLFNVITTAIQQYQSFGVPEWITSANNGGTPFAYDYGAIVRYSSSGIPPFTTYVSVLAGAATNTSTPGADGNWLPFNPIETEITISLTNANVTLSPAQYSANILLLTGTLTGNVALIFPNLVGQWLIINRCSGAFSVTAKTAAGTGYVIPNGANATVYGDATNIDLSNEVAPVSADTDPTLADNSGKAVSSNWAKAAFARLAGLSTQIFRVANAVGSNDAVAYGQVSPMRTAVTTPLPASGTSIVGVSHSLGYVPSSVDLEFTCVTSEGGYSPGDVVKVRNMSTGTVAAGISIWATATQVGAPLSSGGWSYNLLPKTGGAAFVPTPANWSYNFVVR